ncbi:MAG: hypothetical protein ACE5HS_08075 [bacterium]
MSLFVDTVTTVLFLVGSQGFVLAPVLLTFQSGHRVVNRILALNILLFSEICVLQTVTGTKVTLAFNYPFFISTNLIFLTGPLLYFYVKLKFSNTFVFIKKDFLHFLPFAFCFLAFVPIYQQAAPTGLSQAVKGVVPWLAAMHLFSYNVCAILYLRQNECFNFSATPVRKNLLNWLRLAIIGFSLAYGFVFYQAYFGSNVQILNLGWIVTCAFFYLIGYLELRQPVLYSQVRAHIPLMK